MKNQRGIDGAGTCGTGKPLERYKTSCCGFPFSAEAPGQGCSGINDVSTACHTTSADERREKGRVKAHFLEELCILPHGERIVDLVEPALDHRAGHQPIVESPAIRCNSVKEL